MNSTQDRPSLLRDLKIHQFHMDQNAPCLSFQFLLSITVVPREIKDSGYSIFLFLAGGNKVRWLYEGGWAKRGKREGACALVFIILQIRLLTQASVPP